MFSNRDVETLHYFEADIKPLPQTLIIMGVSGCGKSLIGQRLAQVIDGVFEDADDFHPPKNIKKMAQGISLTDDDRWPWLDTLRDRILFHRQTTPCYVLACSSLKRCYRDRLRGNDSPEVLQFIYLKGSKALIHQRLSQRQDHFMPVDLLDSQFSDLEEPKNAVTIDASLPPDRILNQILRHLA